MTPTPEQIAEFRRLLAERRERTKTHRQRLEDMTRMTAADMLITILPVPVEPRPTPGTPKGE